MPTVPTPMPGPEPAPVLGPLKASSARAIVLFLHGGAESNRQPIDDWHRPWLRTRLMQAESARAFRRAGVATVLLRYRYVGWNAHHSPVPDPVEDAQWALGRLTAEHPGLPVVLLGHSMGARTAVAVADRPGVRGVVALAPWLPPGEPIAPVRRTPLRAAHGTADTLTSAKATRAFVERVRAAGGDAHFTDMGPLGHYMLRSRGRWNDYAVRATLALLGDQKA